MVVTAVAVTSSVLVTVMVSSAVDDVVITAVEVVMTVEVVSVGIRRRETPASRRAPHAVRDPALRRAAVVLRTNGKGQRVARRPYNTGS